MKIVVIDNKAQHISIRPDNAILRNNDDFYMPHFSQDIVCDCGYIVRITRLAKCVAQKFASRCYDSITAGVTFTARDIMQQALESKLPTDEAYCFDHSTAIGTQWLTAEQIAEGGNLLLTTGDSVAGMIHSDLQDEIDRCVAQVSNKLTLKTGDLVFIAAGKALEAKVGNGVRVMFNDNIVLDFQIK